MADILRIIAISLIGAPVGMLIGEGIVRCIWWLDRLQR